MAKKITGYIKLQVPAGKANPAPPIGPALGQQKVGTISRSKIEEIAKTKLQDLNTTSLDSAIRTIEGTARQMGLTVE